MGTSARTARKNTWTSQTRRLTSYPACWEHSRWEKNHIGLDPMRRRMYVVPCFASACGSVSETAQFLLFRKQVPNSLSRSTRFLAELVSVYPFTNTTAPDSWVLLLALPSRRLAYSLLDKYSTVSWIFGSLSSRELRVSILDVLYSGEEAYPSTMDGLTMHDLAVLFSVFAIAQILDTGAERNEPEARRYCSLASLALVYDPVMQHPTLQGIRALVCRWWCLCL